MVRAGLLGLEIYTPEAKKWQQVHVNSRHGFLVLTTHTGTHARLLCYVLMECSPQIVSIERVTNDEDGKPDLVIKFDRSKLETVGRPAIGEFLKKLQVTMDKWMNVYEMN